ncbi:MAG: pyridoxal phosphate-dependent aminotransferase [Pseudobdellovibrio sp.]|uniref:pyridoxal phosphate-dependent aminotransferase n=1 Tax=Pseudobdellovibrio sp. HCB154 TaxID=3386277 RepID=UPI00391731FB|nr:pyridoxal phosphate-dependent aminotransferase [Pseudobdellovibrio sp.]
MLSKRALNLKSSPTLALVAKAKELQAQGHNVISLTVGEPDWPTYKVAAEAGVNAIQTGFTKYTAANGTIELRKAIAMRAEADLGFTYNPAKEIAVTSGAKYAIFAALQVLCDPGDEVIIHSPYWVSYPAMAELADAVPKIVDCKAEHNFKLSAERLEKAITPKTKVFLFCSPSNPTGFVYSKEELKAMADVLKKHPRVAVISDDMYNRLMLNGTAIAPHLLQVAPELRERTVVINGGSKAYSMTGWRIGWAMGPEKILKAIGDYASQSTGAPSSIAQAAAEKALLHSEADIKNTIELLKTRLDAALKRMAQIKDLQVYKPDGAFYLWINVEKFLGRKYKGETVQSSAQFGKIYLEDFFVATVPGEEFGEPGYMRLSFATETAKFNEAMDRLQKMIDQMS